MVKKQNKEDNRLLLGSVRMPDVSNPSRDEVFKRRSAVSDDWEPSKELLDAIKSYEKFSPVVYKDGNGIETIGYGITDKKIIAKYRCGKRMSKREAERLFNRHVDDVIAQMKDSIPNFSAMSNNQKDAMTSYVYNVGIGSVTRKSPKLMEALENKNWKEAAKQMDFGYNDKNNSGLRRRRDEERALFTAYLDMGLEEPTEEELSAAHARMQRNALEDILSSRNELELQDPLRTKFDEAYRIAMERKQPTFTWNGREFATDLKAEGGPIATFLHNITHPRDAAYTLMRASGASAQLTASEIINALAGLSEEVYTGNNDGETSSFDYPEMYIYGKSEGAEELSEEERGYGVDYSGYLKEHGRDPKKIKQYKGNFGADIILPESYKSYLDEIVGTDKNFTIGYTDVSGTDDVAGHLGRINKDKNGEYIISYSDLWDFEPSSYTRDWAAGNLAQKGFAYTQAWLLDKIGNPFIVRSNRKVKFIPDSEYSSTVNELLKSDDYGPKEIGYYSDTTDRAILDHIQGNKKEKKENIRSYGFNDALKMISTPFKEITKRPGGGPVAKRDAIQPPANPTMDFMNSIGEETPYYAGELPGVIITLKMDPDKYKSAMNKAAARRGREYVYKGQDEAKFIMQGLAGAAGAASLAGAGILGRVLNTGSDAVDILLNPYDPTSYLSGFDYIKDVTAKANNLTRIKSTGKKVDEIVDAEEKGENMIKGDFGPNYHVVQTIKGDDEISKEVRKRFIEEVIPAYKNMTKQDMHVMTSLEKQAYKYIDENPKIPKDVNLISNLTGISPYAVDKAIRVRIGENITKLAEDYMRKPETFEFNVSDDMGEGVGGAYKWFDDKVYISKDVFDGDKENLINSLIHEFRHKFDLSELRDDAIARRNSLDRIDASDFNGQIDIAYQPTYTSGVNGTGSVREKIATNAQLRDKIYSRYFYQLGINPKEGDFANTVDNISDDDLMDLLEETSAYGKDYARSARDNFDVETRANSIRYLLKNLPSSLPFGMNVDLLINNSKDENEMKDGGSTSDFKPYNLETHDLPSVDHILDIVSDANSESADQLEDAIIGMGYVPYIKNYFKDGGSSGKPTLTAYYKKWNEWMKRPRISRRKDPYEDASELDKIQMYYNSYVIPKLKKKMRSGGYTEKEIEELKDMFRPSGNVPGSERLDAIMGTIQELKYGAYNALRNDILKDESYQRLVDDGVRRIPPEDFLTLLRNTNGFGADYARRFDEQPDSGDRDEQIYEMQKLVSRTVPYAPLGLGASYYNNTSDEDVEKRMGGLVQHFGDRIDLPEPPKKTPEDIKRELDKRYKITPDMSERERLLVMNLRSLREGGELSTEYKVKYLYKLLREEAGMSQNQALAVLGNLKGESNWSETKSGDTNTSYGIQQWHGPRRDKLIEYAMKRSRSSEPTFWDQAHFLIDEYNNDEGFLGIESPVELDGYISYSKDDFKNAESLHDAVVAWNQGFGRPHKSVMRTEDRYKGALEAAKILGITVDESLPSYYGINGISEDPITSDAGVSVASSQKTDKVSEDEIPVPVGLENMTQEERRQLWWDTYGKQMVEDRLAEEEKMRKEQEDARRMQFQQQAETQAKRDAAAAEQARRAKIINEALDKAMLNIPGMARGK